MKEFTETIICVKCGNKLAQGEKRCPSCGSKKTKVQLSGFEEPDEATKRRMRAYDMANEYLKTNKNSVKDVTAYLMENGFTREESDDVALRAVDDNRIFDSEARIAVKWRLGAMVIALIFYWLIDVLDILGLR